VNAILREFDDERKTEVLVITADGGLGAMLVSALSLSGYSPSLVPSCQQAVVEVRQRLLQEAEPSVLILDSAALRAGSGLIDFTSELKAAWPVSSSAQRLPPLLLVSAENPGAAHLPEQQTLEAPFSVHAFLERVQACIANSPGAGA
jgi:DNA-binding response OmpR family regulator